MKYIGLLLAIFLAASGSAQKTEDVWLEGRAKAGFLAAHRSIMGHLPVEYAFAGEWSVLFQSKNRKQWHEAYNQPLYGMTAFYSSVGNKQVLGHYMGGYGFVSFPFYKGKKYRFSGRVGTGLAYGTKYYKKNFPEDSTSLYNVAISTPVNVVVVFALENRFVFGRHSISAAMDMTHFSNGATKVPNLGLNLPFLSLGYGFQIQKGVDTNYVHPQFMKSWEFGFMSIASVKEVEPIGGKKYPVLGFNLLARRIFTHKTGMEVSFDVISKQAVMAEYGEIEKKQSEIIQLGVFAGYILPMNRFHLLVGMGWYARDKFKPEDPLYHRVGMRYRFDNGLNLNLVLKSHWARADYVEYGIGYTLKR